MKKRVAIVAGVVGTLSLLAPAAALAATSSSQTTVGPECVVITGPNGLTIQVGFAPTGPAGCRHIPL